MPEDIWEAFVWLWYQLKNTAANYVSESGARRVVRRVMWNLLHLVMLGQTGQCGLFMDAYDELAHQLNVQARREHIAIDTRTSMLFPQVDEDRLCKLAWSCGQMYLITHLAQLDRAGIDQVAGLALMHDPEVDREKTLPELMEGLDPAYEGLRRLYWQAVSHRTPHTLVCAIGEQIAEDQEEKMIAANRDHAWRGGVG